MSAEPSPATVPDLGSYAKPPVVEVVAAVRFQELAPDIAYGFAEFWRTTLSAKLPNFSVQAPYSAPAEQFSRRARVPDFSFDVSSTPPAARLWFASISGDELVQLQPNWLACNWRKVSPDAEYGRWRRRREYLQDRYGELDSWVRSRGSSLTPDQCEVTYINHVQAVEGLWGAHSDPEKVFVGSHLVKTVDGLRAEQEQWQSQYLFDVEPGSVGRLHVKVNPAFNIADESAMFVVELTARGQPIDSTIDGVLNFLDAARRAVVLTFNTMTTGEARDSWGQEW